MQNKLKKITILLATISSFIFSACGSSPGDEGYATMYMDIRGSGDGVVNYMDYIVTGYTYPSSVDGMDCYMINVTGSGIASRDSFSSGGAHCTYMGETSPFVSSSTGGAINLTVPTGTGRLIQVIGFDMVSDTCPSSNINSEYESKGDDFYHEIYDAVEIGRTTVDIFSDMDVSISNSYDPNNPKSMSDCKSDFYDDSSSSDSDMEIPATGLALWVKADTITNFSNGEWITSSWNDHSGKNNYLTPYQQTCYPAFFENQLNGYPDVEFHGDSYFRNSSLSSDFVGLTGFTAFLVSKYTSAGLFFKMCGESCSDQFKLTINSGSTEAYAIDNSQSASVYVSNSAVSETYYIHTVYWNSASAGDLFYKLNNNSAASGVFTGGTPTGFNFSDDIYLGWDGSTSYLSGHLAELIFYARALTADEQTGVITYLNNKYAVY